MKEISVLVIGVVIGLVLMLALSRIYVKVKASMGAWIAKRKAAAVTLEQRVIALEEAEAARVAAIGIAAKAAV